MSYFNALSALLKSAAVPLIVVYTMLDSFVDELTIQLAVSSHGKIDDEGLEKHARSKAESSVQERHKEVTRLAGESLPYAAVSSKRVGTWSLFISAINLDSSRKLQIYAPKFSRAYSPSSWDT